MAQQLDEIPCPKCRNTIKAKSLLCPHCGAEFTRAEADERASKHYRDIAGGCLVLIAIMAALWWAFLGGDDREGLEPQAKFKAPTEAPARSEPKKPVATEELEQRLATNPRGNSWSQKLLAMSEKDRTHSLSTVAECTATGRAMFMGSDAADTDSWSVGCHEGDVMVSISADDGSTRILECSILPQVNLECWHTFDELDGRK